MVNPVNHAPKNKRLLLRYYFGVVFGIALLALLLDLLLANLINDTRPRYDSLFALAQSLATKSLAQTSSENTEQLLSPYQLTHMPVTDAQLSGLQLSADAYTLVNGSDNSQFMYWLSPDQQTLISFGPIKEPHTPKWPAFIFYASLFVVLTLWLRPLLRDLDQLAQAVNAFRKDYRAALPQLKKSSNLQSLAHDLEAMAEQIRRQIDTQKDLTNVLSHEMRTPLSRIKFSLALMTPQNNLTGQQKQELADINSDVHELEDLTKAMLDFAKLDHPDMAVEPQWLDGAEWLGAYHQKQQRLAQKTPIDSQISIDNQAQGLLFADPYWLELALNNVWQNGLRFAKKTLHITLEISAGEARFLVADDGPGISPDQFNQVTRPFYQAPGKTQKGFGLGLALVKRIAQLHGGDIEVRQSNLGGALITFNLKWKSAAKT